MVRTDALIGVLLPPAMDWNLVMRADRLAVRCLLFGFVCIAALPAASEPIPRLASEDPYAAHITEASRRFGVPAAWIRAVMRAESADDVRAVSPKGAMGLMQLMPGTWTELRDRYRLGNDPFAPRDNILAGTAYLSELRDRYGAPGFLAAYNAGPGRYETFLAGGAALPPETRAYVAMLVPLVRDDQVGAPAKIPAADPLARRHAPLFITRPEGMPSANPAQAVDRLAGDPAAASGRQLSAVTPRAADLFVGRPDRVGRK
ncbi:lytic transglycosylase domain-containing protein [Chelatococcus reniformis]|uniref:Transglycosylase SLT domain-containing protein n=1 Tax=Chelatococcus reniformis TaxID=1494448 RepID=A0A916XRX9_9HYPH|nr:lytic transglycosylase domain-containing protein [Chelatococcus reniformis]GGC94289.1 hypothetical protein GCM10010994_60100 [Chelatococcus reniformis]